MEAMGWSWPDYERTPLYVRRYCWDILQAKRRAQQEAHEQSMREARRGQH